MDSGLKVTPAGLLEGDTPEAMFPSQGPGRPPLLCGMGRGGKWPLLWVAEEAGEMASPSGQPTLLGWWVPDQGRVWGQGPRLACFVLGPQRKHCLFWKTSV